MKYVVAFAVIFLCGVFESVDAVSEPVCAYRNSQDETIFLKYLPLLKKGQDYVDFGANGKCTKRAICNERFDTEVEECSKYPITCANKNRYTGVFPACCIKC